MESLKQLTTVKMTFVPATYVLPHKNRKQAGAELGQAQVKLEVIF